MNRWVLGLLILWFSALWWALPAGTAAIILPVAVVSLVGIWVLDRFGRSDE